MADGKAAQEMIKAENGRRKLNADVEQVDGTFKVLPAQRPFENLVALHVRWPGNRIGRKFPTDLLLEIEEHHLSIPNKSGLLKRIGRGLAGHVDGSSNSLRLRVRLKYCHVRWISKEMNIIGGTKYQIATVEGKFQHHRSEKSRDATKSMLGAGLGAKVAVTPVKGGGSLEGFATASYARQINRTIESTKLAQPDIYEVQAVPNGWRVGDPEYGVARRRFRIRGPK